MKYFVVSDIHGFFNEFKSALRKVGFNKRNKNHTLVICGDIFDRGGQALDIYHYIMSIPKKRRILIKGNHESLYKELLNKHFPEEHDFHNHTVDTFCQIAGERYPEDGGECYGIPLTMERYLESGYHVSYGMMADVERIDPEVKIEWLRIRNKVKDSEITKWLFSDEWKDYFEFDNYICVHSFIPLKNLDGLPSHYIRNRRYEYNPNWREDSTPLEWDDATWGCPFQKYKDGYFNKEMDNNKTLICGHWCTSDFFEELKGQYRNQRSDIFATKGLIAIDGGVWMYGGEMIHPQNVLVIEDGKVLNELRD